MKKGTNFVKRVLSFIMAFALILTCVPAVALADDGTEEKTAPYYVAGTSNLCGSTWTANDAANQMTYNSEGLCVKTYKSVYPGSFEFKITDGTWDNSWGKDGGQANYTFMLDRISDVTITFNPSTKAITVTTEATGETLETVSYKATLHFADAKNWGSVYLHAWTNIGDITGGWPGTALAQGEDGFYSMTVRFEAPEGSGMKFLFNNGGDSGKTLDLILDGSAFVETDGVYTTEKWVVATNTDPDGKFYADIVDAPEAIAISPKQDGNTVTFQYKAPDAGSVSVAGTMNSWTPAAMTRNAYGVWTVTLEDVAYGLHQYKFIVDDTWLLDPLNTWIYTEENGNQNSAFLISDPSLDTNTVKINIHYAAPTNEWNVCAWGAKNLAPQYNFTDGVATITLDGRANQYVAFKVRRSIPGNDWYEQSGEIRVDLPNIVSGTIDVWVGSGFSVSQSLNADVVYANKVKSVELNYDNNTIVIQTAMAVSDVETAFALYQDGVPADIDEITVSGGSTILSFAEKLELADLYRYKIAFLEDINEAHRGGIHVVGTNTVYASDKFAEEFTYDGELGALWSSESTTFQVWAPTASAVSVNLYASGTEGTDDLIEAVVMTAGENGTWYATVEGDLNGTYYTYAVTVDGNTVEAVDPYARTTGVNGKRGMVIDLDSTDPEGWDKDCNPNPIEKYSDAIIYELHVRDFSIDDSSGVSEANRGKYLAFTEEGTTTANGSVTGIDYLKSLGFTHLHLLPVYDYGSVDETKCENFNWGYDPVNYNTPEGSYSTDPYNGEVRVKEFKEMVMALHEADISVIMDVVYNHVYDAGKFCMNQIVPKYFSRVNADCSYSNGSGCGNDTASEREMVRKYIVESVLYWHQEYHIDGFRFDLVGLLDATTINQIVDEVHECCPDVIFYGEGWTLGTAVEPGNGMATQANSAETPEFAYFSDTIRNLLAGSNGTSLGFVSGLTGQEETVAYNFMAKPWWTSNPQQIVQYASCHDNYTLIDKLILSTGKSGIDEEIIKMNNLAAAIYMTSQGISFIHAGEEFLREKLEEDGGRCENSYNASDYVNHIEWSNLETADYAANVDYYQGLIEFRKAHPALRMDNAGDIKSGVTTNTASGNVVAMFIDGCYAEDTDDIFVIFNANNAAKSVSLPEGTWTINVKGNQAGTASLGTASGSVSVEAISAMVLTKADEGQDENTGSDTAHDAPPAGYKTIYFTNNKCWSTVNAYAWNAAGSPVNGSWPGTEMTYLETNDYGEDIYYAIIPTSAANIIFNNGSEQTADLTCGVDGTGYYLVDNATGKWTAESYAYRDPVSSEELINLEGATMTLGNSLAMNFVIDTAELTGTDNYAVITKEYADGTEGKSVTINQADWKVYDGTMYYFTYSKVAAKEMTDKITVVVYNSAGEAVTNSWTDSVRDYCMRAIKAEEEGNKNQDKLTLYVDMLNYGAAAQNEFDYYSDDLATSQLTEAQKGYATGDVNAEDHRVTGAGYLGSTLTLGNEIELNFIFDRTTVTQDMYAIATYTNHYGKEKSVTIAGSAFGEYNKDNVKGWYIPVADMSVADGCQVNGESKFMVTCTVYNADGTVVTYARDSVASYVARANADTNNTNPLYTLILKFATSAYNYFH